MIVTMAGCAAMVGLVVPAVASASAPAISTTMVRTANELPGLSHATLLGTAPANTMLTVDVGLTAPNQAGESSYLTALYNQHSALYHHFLTPSQFDAQFGVSPTALSATESWLGSSGAAVSYVSGSGDLIAVQGTTAQLGKLMETTFGSYKVGDYKFIANQSAPAVPSNLPISDVVGLNTLQRMWSPSALAQPTLKSGAAASTSYVGTLVPQDLWGVYDAPSSDEGQGETAGMFGAGYGDGVIADLRVYEQRMGLPVVPVRQVNEQDITKPSVPSDNTIADDDEWNLDTDAISGMAPKLARMDMYFASNYYDASFAVMFSDWADDPIGPKQMDFSYGECEADPTSPYLDKSNIDQFESPIGNGLQILGDAALEQAVLEGRTLFSSAGDSGGSCPAVILPVLSAGNGILPQPLPTDQNYPCASAFAVCVGGTVLTTNGTTNPTATGAPSSDFTNAPHRVDEQSWIYTGGGPTDDIPKPAYQDGVNAIDLPCTSFETAKGALITPGTICRGVPDVAALSGAGAVDGELVGANSYATNIDMLPFPGGGTSLSSPLVVGLWSRIQAAAPTPAGLGFANETFYAVGKGQIGNASRDFYDITSSDLPIGNFYYQPAKGWDYTSGWGALDVANFIRDVDHDPNLTPTHPSDNADLTPYFPRVTCNATMTNPAGNAYDPILGSISFLENDPALDITSASLAPSSSGKDLVATISGASLSTSGPIDAYGGFSFYLFWTYDGTTYFATAEVDPGQPLPATPLTNPIASPVSPPLGTVVYGDGVATSDIASISHTDTGSFNHGTFTINVPLANVGNPTAGSLLEYPYAYDTMPNGVFVADAVDEAVAPPPGEALKLGPDC
jgi:subtilase family serine protease